jgi:hypothetical protein
MNEVPLSLAFCDAVKTHPACASLATVLQWRVPEMKEPQTLPSVTFSARDVQDIGVGAACTGTVEVRLEAQSDDEVNDESHIARANLILAALRDRTETNIRQVINSAVPRRVRLCGNYAFAGGGRGVDGRRWVATVLLRVGFVPAS